MGPPGIGPRKPERRYPPGDPQRVPPGGHKRRMALHFSKSDRDDEQHTHEADHVPDLNRGRYSQQHFRILPLPDDIRRRRRGRPSDLEIPNTTPGPVKATAHYRCVCRFRYSAFVSRLGLRALQLFGAYAAFILASIIAGFLGSAVGIWAMVVWIVALVLCAIWIVRYRRREG